MVNKAKRRIHTKSVRSMLHWAHYRFRQRLLYTAEQHAGVDVKVVTEEYTSKACGVCGVLHHRLGGSKHFRCPSCGWQCDRDVNGARNILLKTLTEQQGQQPSQPQQPQPLLAPSLPPAATSPPSLSTRYPHGGSVAAPSPSSSHPRRARLSAHTETAEA